jgi:hypothetical protein
MAHGKNGRPEHQPTQQIRDQVKALVLAGSSQDTIAKVIGIARQTLTKHYSDELDKTLAQANGVMATNLFNIGKGKDRTALAAQMYWLSRKAGWKPAPTEVVGGDGGPLQIVIKKEDFDL